MATRLMKNLEKYSANFPGSRKEYYNVMRKTGDRQARLQFTLLHTDHIKLAAIIFENLSNRFNEIAKMRCTQTMRIMDARYILYLANKDFEEYTKDDMLYVQGLRDLGIDASQ